MGNNRDLPKYDKSVAIQVVNQPDGSGTANMIINSFRNFSESVNSVTNRYIKQQDQSQKSVLKNSISTAYRQFAIDALKNPDQNAGFAEYKKNSEEYSKGLMQIAGSNKEYVQNYTNYYFNTHAFTIEKNAIAQDKRAQEVAAYARIDQSVRDVKDSIANSVPMVDENGKDITYDATHAQIADYVKQMETEAKLGYLHPDTVHRAEKQLFQTFQQDVMLKEYERAIANGTGAEYLKKVRDPNYHIDGMDNVDKAGIIGRIVKAHDAGKVKSAGGIVQLNHDIKAETKRLATDGGTPNQELMSRAEAAGEKYATQLQNATFTAQVANEARAAATYKTPSELNEYMANLKPKADDPDYFKKNDAYEYAVKAVQQQDKQFRSNPMAQIIKDPSISDQINDYEQAYNADAVGDPGKIYTPFNSIVAKPWMQIIQLQSQRGLTANGAGNKGIRLLDTKQRVPQILSDLQASSPDEKIAYINKLRDEFGEGLPFNLVMKQLTAAGMPPGLSMLRNFDPESTEANDISAAFSMPASVLTSQLKKLGDKAGAQIAEDSFTHVRNAAHPDVGYFSTDSGNATSDFKQYISTTKPSDDDVKSLASTVQQYAGYLYLTGKEGSESSAMKHAENAIASRYDYTKIGNQPIRIPKDYPQMAITSYAEKAKSGVSSYPWYISDGVDRNDAMELINNGHWTNDNVDHGLVWVDANGRQWSDKNGKPMAISFSDANSPAKTETGHVDSAKINHEITDDNLIVGDNESDSLDDQLKDIDQAGKELMIRGKKNGKKFRKILADAKENK